MTEEDIALPPPRANRRVTLHYRLEYWAVRALFAMMRPFGVDGASRLVGGALARVGPLIGPVSSRAAHNLRLAYPDWAEDRISATVRGVWANLGRTVGEYPFLDRLAAEPSRLTLHISEKALALRGRGRPAILVSGHFANWEAMAIALKDSGLDAAIVYRPVNNPLIDAYIIRLRGDVMSRRMIAKGYDGARAAMLHLADARPVAMLVDQKLTNGVAVPFFGHPAKTATAAARLSLRYDAPIIPAAIVRKEGAHFDIFVRDPIEFAPTGDHGRDIEQLTALMTAAIEREVRAHPEQWLWFHRRWGKDV